MEDYGYTPNLETTDSNIARVTAVHKERYEIVCTYGITHARLKSSIFFNDRDLSYDTALSFPTVGDFVLIQYNSSGDSLITKTLERRSFFSRRDPYPGRGEQAVASNFDYVFILMSLNHDYNERRLDRYLTAAWQSGAIPVVLLTKADLVSDFTEQLQQIGLDAAGVDVLAISAKTGYGLSELSKYLKPQNTVVFLGSSGVGKSSLLNALAGEELMATNEIREDDSKGRHTTTHRQLIMLNNGVMIIDTPGMRVLGMWDVTEGLGDTFGDVEDHLGKCRFADCTHENEPGCVIRSALESGILSQDRWQSYQKLKAEAKYSDKKDAFKARLQQRHMTQSKYSRQKTKIDYE
jgi:ribosome biogenesis GTPase